MPEIKPRHRSGYRPEEFAQVRAACLTVAVTLGAYLEDLCVVGGLVPSLLAEGSSGDDSGGDPHPGTNDLDLGLALALLNEERYSELSARLRAEGFEPDTNEQGNSTVQRWRLPNLNITVDFLMPPTTSQAEGVRVQHLEKDFGALVTPGLELAFDERVQVELEGLTLHGERVRRTVPVCGPAAFVILKALAFGDRGEPKDAFDLVYAIRHTHGQGHAIASRIAEHAAQHGTVVRRALALLARDFRDADDIGPSRAATFEVPAGADQGQIDNAAADAHGHVADLLERTRSAGLNDETAEPTQPRET